MSVANRWKKNRKHTNELTIYEPPELAMNTKKNWNESTYTAAIERKKESETQEQATITHKTNIEQIEMAKSEAILFIRKRIFALLLFR